MIHYFPLRGIKYLFIRENVRALFCRKPGTSGYARLCYAVMEIDAEGFECRITSKMSGTLS